MELTIKIMVSEKEDHFITFASFVKITRNKQKQKHLYFLNMQITEVCFK